MSRYRSDTRHAALRLLDAYWTDLHDQIGGTVPARSAIDPRGLDTVLDRIFILERIAPGVARIRLSGVRLNDLAGVDVRGLPFSAMFTPPARARLEPLITRLFSGPSVLELSLEAETGPGQNGFDGAMLLCPLRDNSGVINRAIGAFADPHGPTGRPPRRFAIREEKVKDLKSIVSHHTLASETERPNGYAFAEEAEPLLRPGPRLRVIQGDD